MFLESKGHTAFTRGKQHLEAIKKAKAYEVTADLDNGLVGSDLECHKEEDHQFKMEVNERFQRPMQRQIAEGVAIHCSQDSTILNGKNKWVQPATSRLSVTRSVEERVQGVRRR